MKKTNKQTHLLYKADRQQTKNQQRSKQTKKHINRQTKKQKKKTEEKKQKEKNKIDTKTFQALHAVFLLSLFQIRIYSRANLRTGRCRTTFKILPFFWDFFKKLRLTCKAAALFCLPPQERFPTSSWSPGHYHWHHHDDWLWIKRMAPCVGRWSSGKLEFRPSLHPTRS